MKQELVQKLHAIAEAQPFTTTWTLRDCATGDQASRDGALVVPSASTRKTSILMHALAQVAAGTLDLAETCVVEARLQKDVNSGTYQHMTPGTRLPLRDAMINMIITSDNVGTQLVLERLDRDTLNAWCKRIGMVGTTHRQNIPPAGLPWDHAMDRTAATTSDDQVRLLDLVLKGAAGDAEATGLMGVPQDLCQLGLDILSWQRLRNLIPSLLPASTKVAHKTGRDARGRSDAGIVFREGRPLFILAVYCDRVPDEMPDGLPGFAAAYATAGRLARACWDAL